MDLNNTVIKVLNEEHGAKVIEFYKKNGYNTGHFYGSNIGYHYGVYNNNFSWYTNSEMKRFDFKVIELPEEEIDLNNTCILANSAEKAKKIIEFYKKNGIFIAFFSDNEYPPISGRPDHIYYGVSYNQLYVACKQDIDERLHWKIIELPEETTSCMVHIIKNSEGKPIGWEMCPQTEEEHKTVAIIRDLQFFGMDETYPSYNGLELIDPDKGKCTGNIKRISWLMRKYQNK